MTDDAGVDPSDLDACCGHADSVRGHHDHVAGAGENTPVASMGTSSQPPAAAACLRAAAVRWRVRRVRPRCAAAMNDATGPMDGIDRRRARRHRAGADGAPRPARTRPEVTPRPAADFRSGPSMGPPPAPGPGRSLPARHSARGARGVLAVGQYPSVFEMISFMISRVPPPIG
jgi:hypothetical protein